MIESPGFPDKYPHNLECSYMIIAPPRMDITLTFLTFDLENDPLLVGEGDCKYDWLDVWDGLPQGESTHTQTHTHRYNCSLKCMVTHMLVVSHFPTHTLTYQPSISRAAIAVFDVSSDAKHSFTLYYIEETLLHGELKVVQHP